MLKKFCVFAFAYSDIVFRGRGCARICSLFLLVIVILCVIICHCKELSSASFF